MVGRAVPVRIAVIILLVATLTVTGTATAAAPPWAAEPVSGPLTTDANFLAVSCFAADGCVGVGDAISRSGTQLPMAQRWDGASWTETATPAPAGARAARLAAVSCVRASFCVAVGDAVLSGGANVPLALRWNGLRWTSLELPATRRPSMLAGVDCRTARSCVAVGSTGGTSGVGTAPLAEVWDGSSWRVTPVPRQGHDDNRLVAVSCSAADVCLAVGDTDDPVGVFAARALATAWDGTSWRAVDVPLRNSALADSLTGVSCPDTQCLLVGSYVDRRARHRGYVAQWDGSAVQPPVRSATAQRLLDSVPRSVSCVSASDCTLVGASTSNTTYARTFAERWDGAALTITATPNGPLRTNLLTAVSCTASPSCLAVGRGTANVIDDRPARPLTVSWDGAAWTRHSGGALPALAPLGLATVSCWAPGSCLAVGAESARQRHDDAWRPAAALPPAAPDEAFVAIGVSCPAARECVAVGTRYHGYPRPAYAARWDGTGWTLILPPDDAELRAVSCMSATACTAVGAATVGAESGVPVAQEWDGTAWTRTVLPDSGHDDTDLVSVSCTSPTECTAVGSSFDFNGNPYSHSVVYRRSGGAWTLQPDDAPSISTRSGVSCAAATACVAVGEEERSTAPSAEVWDGTRWTATPVSLPPGAQFGVLSAVSCAAARACTAVGTYSASGTVHLLRLTWDGSQWTLRPLADPVGALRPELDAVSCVAASACAAVGAWAVGSYYSAPLAVSSFG